MAKVAGHHRGKVTKAKVKENSHGVMAKVTKATPANQAKVKVKSQVEKDKVQPQHHQLLILSQQIASMDTVFGVTSGVIQKDHAGISFVLKLKEKQITPMKMQ